jgi:hypothetical protein
MLKKLLQSVRENRSPLTKIALAYMGVRFFRKIYPEARRYLRLHAM